LELEERQYKATIVAEMEATPQPLDLPQLAAVAVANGTTAQVQITEAMVVLVVVAAASTVQVQQV
jgi:hypothetical protein